MISSINYGYIKVTKDHLVGGTKKIREVKKRLSDQELKQRCNAMITADKRKCHRSGALGLLNTKMSKGTFFRMCARSFAGDVGFHTPSGTGSVKECPNCFIGKQNNTKGKKLLPININFIEVLNGGLRRDD